MNLYLERWYLRESKPLNLGRGLHYYETKLAINPMNLLIKESLVEKGVKIF